jgi:hypothetical protein
MNQAADKRTQPLKSEKWRQPVETRRASEEPEDNSRAQSVRLDSDYAHERHPLDREQHVSTQDGPRRGSQGQQAIAQVLCSSEENGIVVVRYWQATSQARQKIASIA